MKHLLAAAFLIAACAGLLSAEEPATKKPAKEPAKEPAKDPAAKPKVAVGEQAPAFKIKDATGKIVDLAELTAKGPVLVRLTCGCSGCDMELAYFQQINEAYKGKGLTSLLVFKEPDEKMAKYAVEKKLDMLYAVDSKGESWDVFQTKSMPSNFLILKGGKIASIAAGCDPSGLLANVVSDKAAKVVGAETVDVKKQVEEKKSGEKKEKKDKEQRQEQEKK